jgi:hypothetical protein
MSTPSLITRVKGSIWVDWLELVELLELEGVPESIFAGALARAGDFHSALGRTKCTTQGAATIARRAAQEGHCRPAQAEALCGVIAAAEAEQPTNYVPVFTIEPPQDPNMGGSDD